MVNIAHFDALPTPRPRVVGPAWSAREAAIDAAFVAGDPDRALRAVRELEALGRQILGTTPLPPECNASQSTTGPDHHPYRIDTYIIDDRPVTTYTQPPGTQHATSRALRRVTVVVRDGRNTNTVLAREMSTFDCSTALPYATGCPTS